MKRAIKAALDAAGQTTYQAYLALYDEGRYHDSITVELAEDLASLRAAPGGEEGFWLGQAVARWECGALSPALLKKLSDPPPSTPERAALLRQLSAPPSKPRPRKNRRRNLPPYGPGVGLSVPTPEGRFCAFLVLAIKPGDFGSCLLIELDYHEESPPTREVFEARQWLILTHHIWKGKPHCTWYGITRRWRPDPQRVTPICKIALRPDDLRDANAHTFWNEGPFCQAPLQRRWDAGDRT